MNNVATSTMRAIRNILWSRRLLPLKLFLYYPFRRVLDWARIKRGAADSSPPVIIYQMGKVASKTIEYSIRRHTTLPVFHAHMISPANMVRRRPDFESIFGKQYTDYYFSYGKLLYREIFSSSRRARIITLVREPIGRNISQYFQNLDYAWKTNNAHRHIGLDVLINGFHNGFYHTEPLQWFDDEVKPVTGIDVYSKPFPQKVGYAQYQNGRYDLLIMHHDLADPSKAKIIGNFLGVENIKIARENSGVDKSYSDVYKEFISKIRLSDEYIEKMLGSAYARHFYSDEQIKIIRMRWQCVK